MLRVSSVEQGGPAQRAGLEPGDIVIGANDKALGGLDQLTQLAQQGVLKNVLVLDVNTGKTVRVPIEVTASQRPSADESFPARGERQAGHSRHSVPESQLGPRRDVKIAGNLRGTGQRSASAPA